jgi:hypothetical protein
MPRFSVWAPSLCQPRRADEVGGLARLNEDGRDGTLMARAIITVRRDDGTSGYGTPRPSAPLSSHVRLRDRHRRPD